MVRCSTCGTQNRIPPEKDIAGAKCGKCSAPLKAEQAEPAAAESVPFRCVACGARNRIPSDKVSAEAKCGNCGAKLNTEELLMAQPVMVAENSFDQLVLNSPLPVLVYAWTPWCPTCKTATPVIHDFAKDARGKIRVAKLNVDASPTLSAKYNILSVPQILVFDNGRLQETMAGAMPKPELMIKMARYL